MRLTLTSQSDRHAHLECEGEITQYQFTPGRDPLLDVLGPYIYRLGVLLGLEKTSYVDSSGISWLLSAHKQFRSAGGRLVLHSVPPSVRQVFELLKLHTVLTVAADAAEGQKKLAEGVPT
jgi:anti-anti-sigma factor